MTFLGECVNTVVILYALRQSHRGHGHSGDSSYGGHYACYNKAYKPLFSYQQAFYLLYNL
jgi:hypothetical protein